MNTEKADRQSQLIVSYLFTQAFAQSRDVRSQAYKDGVIAALSKYVLGTNVYCRFDAGTPENDAFFAGTTEGYWIGEHYSAGEIAIPDENELPRKIVQLRGKMKMQEDAQRSR